MNTPVSRGLAPRTTRPPRLTGQRLQRPQRVVAGAGDAPDLGGVEGAASGVGDLGRLALDLDVLLAVRRGLGGGGQLGVAELVVGRRGRRCWIGARRLGARPGRAHCDRRDDNREDVAASRQRASA
jgi:hypothetical protein